jgi:cytidylate kinase
VPADLQIAIDGPAASGKTTVARLLAQRLGVVYVDTGAMYRALALAALQTQTDVDNESALARLFDQQIRVSLDHEAQLGFRVFWNNRELSTEELDTPVVTAVVSIVAAHPRVREAMVREQRRIAAEGSVVMAGRDIATVVLPNASCKIFLTASVAARVHRRRAQLEKAGIDVSAHELTQEIEERDRLDETRKISPLRKSPGARTIDSSELTAEQVVDEICRMIG